MASDILVMEKISRSFEAALEDKYTAHRLYEQEHRDSFLDAIAPKIGVLIAFQVSGALMARLPNLKLIVSGAAGYEAIDLEAAKARGIRVTNAPGVYDDAVAETTIGLMLALARCLLQTDQFVRAGKWGKERLYFQHGLVGRTVGILGLGRIGKAVAERCLAMKMKVVYCGRTAQPEMPYDYFADPVQMARAVDWFVAVVPGGPATKGLVSRAVLEALGPDSYFVNVARGSVVDEPALIELLQTGALAGAALDVFENEPTIDDAFFALENVVLSPHQASNTFLSREGVIALMMANLDAHFSGKPLLTPVA